MSSTNGWLFRVRRVGVPGRGAHPPNAGESFKKFSLKINEKCTILVKIVKALIANFSSF